MSQIKILPQHQARHPRAQDGAPIPELSVVIPTFKEHDNVEILVQRIDAALSGIAWEAIFVDDDSPDGTADALKRITRENPRVRCLKRVSRPGPAGSWIEGMLSSMPPYVAGMEAPL